MPKVFLFGVPTGFEIFPPANRIMLAYYQQYYNNSTIDDHRLIIRQSKNFIKYTYIRFNLLSGINRTGSLWGMSIVLEGKYFRNPLTILNFFDTAFIKLLETGKIFARQDTQIKFVITSFSESEDFLNNVMEVLTNQIQTSLKSEMEDIPAGIAEKNNPPSNTALISEEASATEMNEAFYEYGSVIISPSISLKKNSKVEINVEPDFEEYGAVSDMLDKIKTGQQLLMSEIYNVQTGFSELSIQPETERSAFLQTLQEEWLQVTAQLKSNGEQLGKIEQQKILQQTNGLSATLTKDIKELLEMHNKQLRLIEKIKATFSTRVNVKQEEPRVNFSRSPNILRKRSVQIFAGCLVLLILYFIVSNSGHPYNNAINKANSLFTSEADSNTLVDAREWYQKALSYKPGDPIASGRISMIQRKLNRLGAVTPSPTFPLELEDAYQLAINKGDSNFYGYNLPVNFQKAKKRYQEALSIKPDDPLAVSRLGEVETALQNEQRATNKKKKTKAKSTRKTVIHD